MNLLKHIFRGKNFIIVMALLFCIWGISSFFTIPRSEDPQIEFSGSSIFVMLPGASPGEIEKLVVNPIEEELNKLSDIDDLFSSSSENVALIHIKFSVATDQAEKYQEVITAIGNVRTKLPSNITRLEVNKYSSSDVSILQYALIAPQLNYEELAGHAKALKKKVQRVAGVRNVQIHAYPEQQIKVEISPEKLETAGLSLDGIAKFLSASNTSIPGGAIIADNRRFSVRVKSELTSLDEIRNTVVGVYGSQSIKLADIAKVSFSDADTLYRARYMGERAVLLSVAQKKGTNIFPVTQSIKKQIESYKKKHALQLRIVNVFDQSKSVDRRLNGFFKNLLQGMGLVSLVIFLALGFRAAAIIVFVIPLSILTAIGILDITGFGLDQISIVGLAIALGMLVDNGIVFIELVGKKKREGLTGENAAVSSIREIGWATVSSTLTTVIAFLPMAFIGSYTGEFIRGLPLTVIFALAASLLFALTVTPLLSGLFLPSLAKEKRTFTQRFFYSIAENGYRKFLNFSLKRPKFILLIIVLVLSLSFYFIKYLKVSLFPDAEKPFIFISIETPKGSGISKVDSVAVAIERILNRNPEVLSYVTNIGKSNPRIYYNMLSLWESPNIGQVVATISSGKEEFVNATIDKLRKECGKIPGAKIYIQGLAQGMPVDAPIAIRILGENLDSLKIAAGNIQRIIEETSGTVNVRNPANDTRTDLSVDIKRDKASLAGITPVSVALALRTAVLGRVATIYKDNNGDEFPVTLYLDPANRAGFEDIEKVTIPNLTGENVPVRQVAEFSFEQNPSIINHFALERSFAILSDVRSGYNTSEITAQVKRKIREYSFPQGVSWMISGEEESREEAFGGMMLALVIALVGIYAVLVLQFGNFLQPLIVFTAIPFAIIGSILALVTTGYTFSFTAFIGFTSLMGIVVNDSIVLIDYANKLRNSGKSLLETIQEASIVRFTPIVLTTITTMLGLLPLLLSGSSIWTPLSLVIFYGLAVASIMILLIVPVLYIILTKKWISEF